MKNSDNLQGANGGRQGELPTQSALPNNRYLLGHNQPRPGTGSYTEGHGTGAPRGAQSISNHGLERIKSAE